MIQVGMKAPNFTLLDQSNNLVSLSDFLGKKVVVYFYPKDHTPGCTTQACAFRDAFDGFKEKDIVVIGISKDTVESHKKFVEDYNLPFVLLADPELVAIQAYDVWKQKNMYGKLTYGVARSTFVIDENGNVVKIFLRANPDTNAKEILEFFN